MMIHAANSEFMVGLIEGIQNIQKKTFGKQTQIFVMFIDDGPNSYASTDACPVKVIDRLQKAIRAIMGKMSRDEFEICDDCPGMDYEE